MAGPHVLQWYVLSESLRSCFVSPQFEHSFDDGSNLSISMTFFPLCSALAFSIAKKNDHPASDVDFASALFTYEWKYKY